MTTGIQNNVENFLSCFLQIKAPPLYILSTLPALPLVPGQRPIEINCHRIVEWNRYWNTGEEKGKSLISQTLIKRHDNPRIGRRESEAKGTARFHSPMKPRGDEINTVDIFPCGSIDSSVFVLQRRFFFTTGCALIHIFISQSTHSVALWGYYFYMYE